METKPNRVPQIYGYTVCVIAVVTFLICATVIVNNVFDLANPIQAASGFESSLSSFEAYQATQQRGRVVVPPGPSGVAVRSPAAAGDTASLAALRKQYEALRADRIARVRFQALKAVTTSALLLIISVVLFVLHWRWLRKPGAAGDIAGT